MKFLSLFSGIEAASRAWEPLGWQAVGFSEIEKFPCEFLASRYPHIPNLGDVTKITEQQISSLGQIDIVVFGSPCQDLSIAGKRRGLLNESGDVTRSGLFFSAINIFNWARKNCGARFALWENVPGAFSSNKGRDFASVVSLMAGIDDVEPPANGWGKEGVALGENGLLEWCILDAQWFRVAQRRRRVFAILDTGNWADRPPILLEPISLRGNTPPSRETGKTVARDIETSIDEHSKRNAITWPAEIAPTLNAHFGSKMGLENQHINSGAGLFVKGCKNPNKENFVTNHGACFDNPTYALAENTIGRKPKNGGNGGGFCEDLSYTLNAIGVHGVCTPIAYRTNSAGQVMDQGEISATLNTFTDPCAQILHKDMQVRRLTPIECERLQGFPDNWTKLNAKTPDTARYKALGNSMAVPVMHWIGKQIDGVARKKALTNNLYLRNQLTDFIKQNFNQ